MPKETKKEFNARIVREYPGVFKADSSILFCVLCNCTISVCKVYNVQQHLGTAKHKKFDEKTQTTPSQSLLTIYSSDPSINQFSMELCQTFLAANIPLHKINNSDVKSFLEKYTKHSVPSETVLRNKYVPTLYEKYNKKLKSKAFNKKIWVSLDETTDSQKRLVANFVFGILDETEKEKSYLLNLAHVERANDSSMAAFFTDSLQLLWPNGIEYKNVMLVVTDAAPYMVSAMKSLKILYPQMLHVTCLSHGLHRVADFIRLHFVDVNSLIANWKAVFLKGHLIFLLLFAHTIDEASSLGFDSATSCSPNTKQSRRGRAQMLAAIPCDLKTQAYCNLPGAAYPWHAVRRFVHENQGLMKRMYGDVRHISVLRDEIINNEIEVEDIEIASERYSRDGFNHRASKLMHNREDFDNFKSNDVLREPHFRPVTTTTTTIIPTKLPASTTEKLETTTNNSEVEKTTYSEAETKMTAPPNGNSTTIETTNLNKNNLKSKLLEIEENPELTTKTALDEVDNTTVEDEEDEDVNIEFNSVYETPNGTAAPQEIFGDNIEIVKSPQLGFTNLTTDSTVILTTTTTTTQKAATTSSALTTATTKTATTLKPEGVAERAPFKQRKPYIPFSQRQRPSQHLQKVDSTISVKLKLKMNPTQATPSRITTPKLAASANNETKTANNSSSTTPLTSSKTSPFKNHFNKNYNRYTTLHNNRYALPTASPPVAQSLTPSVQSLKSNAELLLGEKILKPAASVSASVTGAGVDSNKPVLKESQLFQDTMKQEPVAPLVSARGVNACPVKEEVVAPFWANNTRGEVLALLNLYPFEQYVHWEKCTHEHKQMYCREGCRCEQQYRLHRLLAYDPHNECRGIFSDWFRFPSCCICKCYNVPLDFRATSRSPRSESGTSEYRHPIEVAEEQVKNAIYEHATEEWYRPKDDFSFYEG